MLLFASMAVEMNTNSLFSCRINSPPWVKLFTQHESLRNQDLVVSVSSVQELSTVVCLQKAEEQPSVMASARYLRSQ